MDIAKIFLVGASGTSAMVTGSMSLIHHSVGYMMISLLCAAVCGYILGE